MKPIHLNLASRPYRDYRPVYAAAVAMGILTAFLLITNAQTYYRYKHETRSTRAKIAEAEAQARRERERAQAVQHRLSNLDLSRLAAQTLYINERLAERAFSWSTLLDELESVLPNNVRLVSIAPAFVPSGPIGLTLQLQSRSANGMTETINRMNGDPQFANPFPSSESMSGETYDFNMTVEYLPTDQQSSARAIDRSAARQPAAAGGRR